MRQITVRQRKQSDVIEQQVACVVDRAAQFSNLLFGIVG
jgi:hypothetical protein